MIKPIENIPAATKKVTVRDMIRADLEEALSNGIYQFEFDGYDEYERLPSNARDAVWNYARVYVNKRAKEFEKEMLRDNETWNSGFHICLGLYEIEKEYIKIKSIKAEPHRRVFCTIDKDIDEKIRERVKSAIDKARESLFWNGEKWLRKGVINEQME